MMSLSAPMEFQLPQTKLAAPKGLHASPSPLPDWFMPPPGLDAPPSAAVAKKLQQSTGGDDSDTDQTSATTGAGSSERDETEADWSEEFELPQVLKADAPCFVPGLLPTTPTSQEVTPQPKRTPLRKGAGLFVPGAAGPAIPFVPMAQVQEAWQRWSEQKEENEVQRGQPKGTPKPKRSSRRGGGSKGNASNAARKY